MRLTAGSSLPAAQLELLLLQCPELPCQAYVLVLGALVVLDALVHVLLPCRHSRAGQQMERVKGNV